MYSRFVICAVVCAASVIAQNRREFDIAGDGAWIDTAIDLQAGDTIKITASGTMQYANAKPCGPEGLPRGWTDLIRQLPLNDTGRGALVGRIGNNIAARPFLIGTETERQVPVAGHLYLVVNQMSSDRAQGSYHVVVQTTAAPKTTAAPAAGPLPRITQQMLDSIPTRVVDAQGNLGDRVNFILVGSEDKVQAAFRAAGWVTVDRSKKDTVIRGLLASVSKEAYVTMPMSELLLFGRPQDYGYAQGDPVRVVASRHHFRIWKALFTADGQTVWAGAGTHDIGFDRDQRNGNITHKIDPDTDSERDYIGQSLQQTGMVVKLDYLKASKPIETARTAHGEEFHSDGRTLLIYLQPGTSNYAAQFADVFCSVLKQRNPDGGDWGACSQYIDGAGREDVSLGAVSSKYRVLIVPGILSSCVGDTPAFDSGKALTDSYGVKVDLLGVPNDPSEANAKLIADHIRKEGESDNRKFIVIGYSKGAPDIQVALADEQGVADHVAAFVTVAGAVGGSPIADTLPSVADKWIRQYTLGGCKGDLASGFKSLKRETRQAFLAAHPRTPVPAYSIVGKSSRNNTSKALLQTWELLAAFTGVEDGQLLRDDAVLPDAKYLGAALADHFAIALPFEKSTDPAIKAGMNSNHYPRAALLESIVRFVSQDLDGAGAGR